LPVLGGLGRHPRRPARCRVRGRTAARTRAQRSVARDRSRLNPGERPQPPERIENRTPRREGWPVPMGRWGVRSAAPADVDRSTDLESRRLWLVSVVVGAGLGAFSVLADGIIGGRLFGILGNIAAPWGRPALFLRPAPTAPKP